MPHWSMIHITSPRLTQPDALSHLTHGLARHWDVPATELTGSHWTNCLMRGCGRMYSGTGSIYVLSCSTATFARAVRTAFASVSMSYAP
jgi:hypothetical protein